MSTVDSKTRRRAARLPLASRASQIARFTLALGGDQAARWADILAPGAAVPVALLSSLASHLISQHAHGQVTRLVTDLRRRVELLEAQGRLDREHMNSLGWDTQLQRVLVAAVVDDPAKVDQYVNLLAGSVAADRPDELDEAALLSVLQALSLQEIGLASEFVRRYGDEPFAPAGGIEAPDWGPDTAFYLQRLQGNGLIVPMPEPQTPGRKQLGDRYDVNRTLLRFVATLRAGMPHEGIAPQPGSDPAT